MTPAKGSLELVCPVGSAAALDADDIVRRAEAGAVNAVVTVDRLLPADGAPVWYRKVNAAVAAGADAVAVAGRGVRGRAARRHADERRYLGSTAVAGNPDTFELQVRRFGVRRVALPPDVAAATIAARDGAPTHPTDARDRGRRPIPIHD